MKLHHIGLVVRNLEKSAIYYEETLNLERISDKTFDSKQKVNILFLGQKDSSLKYELIEPADSQSPAFSWIKKGISLYHLCYETENMEKTIQALVKKGSLLILEPTPAAAFNGKKVAFLINSENLIIELKEEDAK